MERTNKLGKVSCDQKIWKVCLGWRQVERWGAWFKVSVKTKGCLLQRPPSCQKLLTVAQESESKPTGFRSSFSPPTRAPCALQWHEMLESQLCLLAVWFWQVNSLYLSFLILNMGVLRLIVTSELSLKKPSCQTGSRCFNKWRLLLIITDLESIQAKGRETWAF